MINKREGDLRYHYLKQFSMYKEKKRREVEERREGEGRDGRRGGRGTDDIDTAYGQQEQVIRI